MTKARFTPADDIALTEAVGRLGTADWSVIASELPGRNARQCRERWRNYASPELIHDAWTESEDERLVSTFNEVGPRWHHITTYFPGRSRNSLHNRFMALRRPDREKRGKSKTNVASKTSASVQVPRNNKPPPRNQDAMSFLDLFEEEDSVRWITDPNSDFDSFF
jgi:hypothetical protein